MCSLLFSAVLKSRSGGLRFNQVDAGLHRRKTVRNSKTNQPASAEACWRWVVKPKRPDYPWCRDKRILGCPPMHNVAVPAEAWINWPETVRVWRQVCDVCPGGQEEVAHETAWRRIEEAFVRIH
jgi:hypothetical protein